MKNRLPANTQALYASLDDIYFAENPLIYLAEEFYKKVVNIFFWMKSINILIGRGSLRIVPYKPNIEKLALQADTTRDTLLKFLFYLEKAGVVKWLSKDTFGINYLNKPDKLYLNNTNLMYALSNEKPDKGNLRETFILNQLLVKNSVSYPEIGDFLINGKYLIEVGGPSKKTKQIASLENAFIAADDIEFPDGRKIPLWLFGFLY